MVDYLDGAKIDGMKSYVEFVNTIRDTTDTETLRFFITIFILT
jgi:hypothetical protein